MAGFGGDRRGKNSCFRGEINGINCQFFWAKEGENTAILKVKQRAKAAGLLCGRKKGGEYYFQGEIHGITKGQKLPVYRGERRGNNC